MMKWEYMSLCHPLHCESMNWVSWSGYSMIKLHEPWIASAEWLILQVEVLKLSATFSSHCRWVGKFKLGKGKVTVSWFMTSHTSLLSSNRWHININFFSTSLAQHRTNEGEGMELSPSYPILTTYVIFLGPTRLKSQSWKPQSWGHETTMALPSIFSDQPIWTLVYIHPFARPHSGFILLTCALFPIEPPFLQPTVMCTPGKFPPRLVSVSLLNYTSEPLLFILSDCFLEDVIWICHIV